MTDWSQSNNRCFAREIELEKLHGFLQEAMDGQCSVCFVTGEAGAGKSALLAEFCRVARDKHPDLVIADGNCDAQTGIGDPYLPFREILTELAGEADQPDLAPGSPPTDTKRSTRWFRMAAQALVEHGPDLIDIFVPGGAIMTRLGAQAARGTRLGKKGQAKEKDKILAQASGLEQRHLCEQYTNVLKALARRQPLVVIVDDLHWADDASIHLLFHLSRRLREDPVLIIGAYRAEDVALGRGGGRHPLEGTLNEIKRYYGDATVAVGEHGDDGMKFVNALIDSEPNDLNEDFRKALQQRTSGHALFTVELLRHLQEKGILIKDDSGHWIIGAELTWDELPSRVEGIILERVARLDEKECECLSVASVEGESFTAEIISAALDADRREVIRSLSGPLTKRHALVRALGIGRIGGIRLSQYEFRHNLFQKFFYQSLDPIERAHLHQEIGLSMEALFADNVDAVALQLARHFAAADDVEKAVNYLLIAAEQSRESYANLEAQRHLERALELLSNAEAHSLSTSWTQKTRRRLYELLGKVCDTNCLYEQARTSYSDALSLTSEDERIKRAALHRAIATTWERQSVHGTAIEELLRALQLLGDEPSDDDTDWWHEWLSIQLGQIWLYYWTANSEEMAKLIEAVRARMEQFGDVFQRCRFCSGVGMLGYRQERYRLSDKTIAAVDQAVAASNETGSLVAQADALFGAGFARLFADQSEAAVRFLGQSLELAERCGDLKMKGRCLTYLSVAHRQLGNTDEVEKMIPDVIHAIEAGSAPEYRAVVKANESWLAWKRDDIDQARARADEAMQIWQQTTPNYPLKWLAMIQIIAAATEEDRISDAIDLSRALLKPPHALLGNGVGQALHHAVEFFEDQKKKKASASLAEAIGCAKTACYL